MAKKPLLKTIRTRDKFVVELDLASVLAAVEATNRQYRKRNRKDPTGGLPQYRVTNPHQMFRFVVQSLFHPPPGTDTLPVHKYFLFAIEDGVDAAAGKRLGVVEDPDPNCPVSVAEYSDR